MKRILIISYNFSPEPTGIGKYNGEMAEWLVKQGYDCSVITAYPYYPFWAVQEPYRRRRFFYSTEASRLDGGMLSVHRCPLYVPEKPSGSKRILLDISFFITAFIRILFLLPKKKFDLVIAVAPSFQVGWLGVLYKKLRGAKLIYHIQDLQIEAARKLEMIRSERLIEILLRIEKRIFKQADIVSSISEEMVSRIQMKARKQTFLFPNWTDVNRFFPMNNASQLKAQFGFLPSDKVILYSGALGEKQGLESILHAAAKHKDCTDVKFVICGSGPYKKKLEDLSDQLELTNLKFLPLQPAEILNRFLNSADIHLVIQKQQTSDLVMPSKLASILAVGGLALVTANAGTGLYSLIKKFNIGHLVDADNPEALSKGITKLLSSRSTGMKANARAYAENHLSIQKIMGTFESTSKDLWKQ